ncbi:hypothetical protein VNO77_46346 [Canavalia gladiata]|uniref:Uncharacterized protein n=1 Tax=Canavalia gladiata TaxID=3824 RepID=A0AAN9JBZ9_CANGL
MVHLLMGERRGLNPRVVDSQSTALIHLATSAPTPYKIKDRGRAGSEGSFSRKQAPLFEASPHKRKPLHASLLYRVPNLRTPKLQASFEAPTLLIVGILEEAPFYKPF